MTPRQAGSQRESSAVQTKRGTALALLRPLLARFATYPFTIGCSLLTSAILIHFISVGAYAAFTLLASILPLLTFMDLGYGGAATNWAAEFRSVRSPGVGEIDQLKSRLARALRMSLWPLSIGSALCLLLPTVTQSWDASFGRLPVAVLAVALALTFLNVPFSIVSRVLVGLGRNATWTLIQAVQPAVSLGVVATVALVGGAGLAVLSPAISLMAMCLLGAVFALKYIPLRARALATAVARGPVSQEHLFGTAWPMMIIMIASPLTLSTDRLILATNSSVSELASYSLGSQLFAPMLSLMSASGMALWPYYAERRHRGEATSPWLMVYIFAGTAVLCSGVLIMISPLLVQYVAGGKIALQGSLLLAFSLSFVVQAAQLPMSMYMMYRQGPRLQAILAVLTFITKLAIAIPFSASVGAVLLPFATFVAIFVCQLAPGIWLISKRRV